MWHPIATPTKKDASLPPKRAASQAITTTPPPLAAPLEPAAEDLIRRHDALARAAASSPIAALAPARRQIHLVSRRRRPRQDSDPECAEGSTVGDRDAGSNGCGGARAGVLRWQTAIDAARHVGRALRTNWPK